MPWGASAHERAAAAMELALCFTTCVHEQEESKKQAKKKDYLFETAQSPPCAKDDQAPSVQAGCLVKI